MSLLGLTDQELADALMIGKETLEAWKLSYPEFRDSIARGKAEADAHVAEALYHRACGYEYVAEKVFLGTTETGPIIARYTEHIPADVRAPFRWLYNRQPDRRRDRKQVEHMGSLEHRISLMTPEERLTRLRELQAKAGLMIEGEVERSEDDAKDPAR